MLAAQNIAGLAGTDSMPTSQGRLRDTAGFKFGAYLSNLFPGQFCLCMIFSSEGVGLEVQPPLVRAILHIRRCIAREKMRGVNTSADVTAMERPYSVVDRAVVHGEGNSVRQIRSPIDSNLSVSLVAD
jgi:hypothetical protein